MYNNAMGNEKPHFHGEKTAINIEESSNKYRSKDEEKYND